jgi:hypothetical protein
MLSGLLLGLLLTALLTLSYSVLLVPVAILAEIGGGGASVMMYLALYAFIAFGAPWTVLLSGSESALIGIFGGVVLNGALAGLIYGLVYGLLNRRGSKRGLE